MSKLVKPKQIDPSSINGYVLTTSGGTVMWAQSTTVTGFTYTPNQLTISKNNGINYSVGINNFTGLTINGSLAVTSAITTNTFSVTNNPVAGYVLTSDASGNAIWLPVNTPTTGGDTGRIYFLAPSVASDIGGYSLATTNPTLGTGTTIVQANTGIGDNLIGSFATIVGEPAVTSLPVGIALRTIHGNVANNPEIGRYKLEFYQRSTGGTETLLRSGYSDPFGNISIDEITWTFVALSATTLNITDRLVFKLYTARVSGPTTVTVSSYFENQNPSFIRTTIPNPSTDTYTTGFTYNNANILTISRNQSQPNLNVTISNFTGLTVNGSFSATTYLGLPTDLFVTGGTYSNGIITLRKQTGTPVTITGLMSADTFVTGFTYVPNQLTIAQPSRPNLSVGINNFTGLTVNGSFSATTYLGLPASGTFTGNTSATCITDLYISNLHACAPTSPITVFNNLQSITSTANGIYSNVFGSGNTTSSAKFSMIGGGKANTLVSDFATIGGGYNNIIAIASGVSGKYSSIVGGLSNTIIGVKSFIGNGESNRINNNLATIVGGKSNVITSGGSISIPGIGIGNYSMIGGGKGNNISAAILSSIGGGYNNRITNYLSTIGGGYSNVITATTSTISGGKSNVVGGTYSTIGGGLANKVFGQKSFIGGGTSNIVSKEYASIGGGSNNKIQIDGNHSSIGGGYLNIVSNAYSVVGGGRQNTISANDGGTIVSSFIGGGQFNTITKSFAAIGGGKSNVITTGGTYSSIVGGQLNIVTASNTHVIGSNILANAANHTYVENLKIYITPSGGTTTDSILVRSTDGTVKTIAQTTFTGNTSANCITNLYVHNLFGCSPITVWDNFQRNTSTAPGLYSNVFSKTSTVASTYSTISGGRKNTISGSTSSIGGGYYNTINATQSFIGGGYNNTIPTSTVTQSVIGGGTNNIVNSTASFIGGGSGNNIAINSQYNSIVGGAANTISGSSKSFIGGGQSNLISTGTKNVLGGGYLNKVHGTYSTIGGGQSNIISTSDNSTIAGGRNNSIIKTATYSTIGGGTDNRIDTITNSTISGGKNNTITGATSFIGGGAFNISTGLYSVVVAGNRNSSTNTYSCIIGGSGNTISGNLGFIGSGRQNTLSGNNGFIGVGAGNTISSNRSFIGSGRENTISVGAYVSIVNGKSNSVSGPYSGILGGTGNTISGINSFIIGGKNNVISGSTAFIGGGARNRINPTTEFSSILAGSGNTVTVSNAHIIGSNISANTSNYTYVENLSVGNIQPNIVARNDGKLSIGVLQDFTSKLNVDGGALATTPGSQSLEQRFITTTNNTDILDISNTRVSSGTDWVTAGYRIQSKIDNTWMGYLHFNGDNNGGVALGTGNSTAGATGITNSLTIDINGSVKINKTPTTAASGSTTDQILIRSTDGTIKVADAGAPQIYSARVTITSGSVLTIFTTPIQIVPAPASTHYIKIIAATAKIIYNGVAYTNNPQLVLINSTAGQAQYVSPTLFLQGTTAQTKSLFSATANVVAETGLIAGKALNVSTAVGNPSAGNSAISVIVHYMLVPDF